MKRVAITILAAMALTGASYAQGTFNFSNGAAGVNAPVTLQATGANVPIGAAYWVQAFAGAVGTAADSLTAIGSPIHFSLSAGYFFGGATAVPGIAGGTAALIQVRAWDAVLGATAPALGSAGSGASNLVTVNLVTSPTPENNLVGLTGFAITPVPEPSVIALAIAGTGFLFLRRKK